jgi:hypothetical protein
MNRMSRLSRVSLFVACSYLNVTGSQKAMAMISSIR